MHPKHARRQKIGLHFQVASGSDRGRVRTQNEDALALCEPSDRLQLEQFGRLYLLADGAGGHAAGEIASQLAVETIASTYYQQFTSGIEAVEQQPAQSEESSVQQEHAGLALPRKRIIAAFRAAHTRIRECAAQRADYRGMVTTCLAAVVKENHVLIAHLGDSRAYLVRSSPGFLPVITCLTTDHSLAAALAQAGVLSVEQARSSPSRHILVHALGEHAENPVDPDIATEELRAGDVLILCCDGLWGMLSEEQIAHIVTNYPPQHACAHLIRQANEAGGKDNISLILLACS